ncbi:2860_t:CDS:2 [Gigaspora rosea]|nr:2860_t:CDS:2 [Gigaspora rosea]
MEFNNEEEDWNVKHIYSSDLDANSWSTTGISSHMDVNPDEWAQSFDDFIDWEAYDSVTSEDLLNRTIIQRLYEIDQDLPEAREMQCFKLARSNRSKKTL